MVKNTRNILKKFKAGDFSESISLWADELGRDTLNESTHKNLIQAKEHLEKPSEEDASKAVYLNKISALQSFFDIKSAGKFRESQGEKNNESPVSGIKGTANGDIIISDDFNHRIQIYDRNYELKLSFGQKGKNTGEFHYPKGIDIDTEGNLYVADCWNHRIQKFTKDGKFVSTFGSYGSKPGQFNEPIGIVIDASNQLWVVDRCNHRIQCFDIAGNYQGSIGHRGRVIEENLAELFETPPEKFSRPSLDFPSAIAKDSKNDIYVVDSHNHRILKFDSKGKFILSFGRQGKEQCEFLYPQSIAIDRFDNIFISDLNNNRIQLFSPVGEHYFSFAGNGNKEHIESPTILACGKETSLFIGFAFNSKVLVLNYSPISQKERLGLKEEFEKNTANSFYLSANFFHRDQNHVKAIENYEKALSVISDDTEEIIPELPLCYLKLAQKIKNEAIVPILTNYYSNTLNRLNKSILNIYKKRKDITEKQIDPVLKAEKEILEKKLPSSEIDKNLYQLEKEERSLFRETRDVFLELKRINKHQLEMFLLLLPVALEKQNSDQIKKLIEHSLAHFYKNVDFINSFLEDQDSYNSKCFEEIQIINKGSSTLREFRLALVLTHVSSDFTQLAFPILKDSIHLLAQIAMQICASKTYSAIDLFDSLTQENNIKKIGKTFYKLRHDFNAILQLKESLRVLFSYSKLNLDEFISGVLENRSFKIDSLLNKDIINYEKDLIELIFIEELGVFETENGLGVGLYYFNKSELDLFQQEGSASREESYTTFLNQLQSSINKLLSEKKDLDSIILKHEISLKSIHAGDQESRLRITNEYNLINAQSTFGNKLILEHFFLYRIIHFKRHLSLLLDSKLKLTDKKRIEEISRKINAYNDELTKKVNEINDKFKKSLDNMMLWEKTFTDSADSYEIDRAKEIDSSNKLFQSVKDYQLVQILKNEYSSIRNIQSEISNYLCTENQLPGTSNSIEFHHDLQFGSYGNNKGQFDGSSCLCVDKNDALYVTDTLNNRIQKFDLNGNHILTIGSFGDFNGFFNKPSGILCDKNDNLFVCDSLNHRVQKLDSNGNYLMSWGTFGNSAECFNNPVRICQDPEGYLYITDIGNCRVQKYTPDGEFVLSFEKQRKNDTAFYQPSGVGYHENMVLVGDKTTDSIQVFDRNGRLAKSFTYSGGTTSELQATSNIYIDQNGYIYISELWSNKLYILSDEFNLKASLGSFSSTEKNLFDGLGGTVLVGEYMFLISYFGHQIHRYKWKISI